MLDTFAATRSISSPVRGCSAPRCTKNAIGTPHCAGAKCTSPGGWRSSCRRFWPQAGENCVSCTAFNVAGAAWHRLRVADVHPETAGWWRGRSLASETPAVHVAVLELSRHAEERTFCACARQSSGWRPDRGPRTQAAFDVLAIAAHHRRQHLVVAACRKHGQDWSSTP